jgi:hypothetical protein
VRSTSKNCDIDRSTFVEMREAEMERTRHRASNSNMVRWRRNTRPYSDLQVTEASGRTWKAPVAYALRIQRFNLHEYKWTHSRRPLFLQDTWTAELLVLCLRASLTSWSDWHANDLNFKTNFYLVCIYDSCTDTLSSVKVMHCQVTLSPRKEEDWGGGRWKRSTLKETKLRGLSPRANYTDRATAACQRN